MNSPVQPGSIGNETNHQEVEKRHQRRTIRIALGAAAVSFFAAVISGAQLYVARKQQLYADRPWLKPIDLEKPNISVQDVIFFGGSVKIKNVGKSPALNVLIGAKLFPRDEPPEFKEIPMVCKNIRPADDFVSNALFAEDNFSENLNVNAPINTFQNSKNVDRAKVIDAFTRMGRTPRNAPPIKDRYIPSFVVVVCVQYEIYNDSSKHYTAFYYNIDRKVAEKNWPQDTDKISFDMTLRRSYSTADLKIYTDGYVARAD